MPFGNQIFGCHFDSAHVINRQAVVFGVGRIEELKNVLRGKAVFQYRFACAVGGRENQRVHAVAVHIRNDVRLGGNARLIEADDEAIAVFSVFPFQPLDDRAVEGVGNFGDNQPNGVGLLLLEAFGDAVGDIVHLLCALQDGFARAGLDFSVLCKGARYGCNGNPAGKREVLYGCHGHLLSGAGLFFFFIIPYLRRKSKRRR